MDRENAHSLKDSNPFLSGEFTRIWSRYFYPSGELHESAFVEGMRFIKRKTVPIYENVGTRITQGLAYEFRPHLPNRSTAAVNLIYDVPSHYHIHPPAESRIGLKKIKQYPAYAIDLKNYKDVDSFLAEQFSSSGRWQIKRALKRFEGCYETSVKVLYGPDCDRENYNALFDRFRSLLLKRYESKNEEHRFLEEDTWKYLHELVFNLIADHKALLLVVNADNSPVAINLCYVYGNTVTLALPAFDINFGKFKLGHLSTLYTLEWCLQNKMSTYDFSKGHYDYKKRWSNREYTFDYHIVYDKRSLMGTTIAHLLAFLFKAKNRLRELELDSKFHRIKYNLKHSGEKESVTGYEICEVTEAELLVSYAQIEPGDQPDILEGALNDFLFQHSEKRKEVSILKLDEHHFLLKGNKVTAKVVLRINPD